MVLVVVGVDIAATSLVVVGLLLLLLVDGIFII
jgi:hypothetical protein